MWKFAFIVQKCCGNAFVALLSDLNDLIGARRSHTCAAVYENFLNYYACDLIRRPCFFLAHSVSLERSTHTLLCSLHNPVCCACHASASARRRRCAHNTTHTQAQEAEGGNTVADVVVAVVVAANSRRLGAPFLHRPSVGSLCAKADPKRPSVKMMSPVGFAKNSLQKYTLVWV